MNEHLLERILLHSVEDIVKVRLVVREYSQGLGFGLVDQTKIVTAASELARNTVEHGKGGILQIEKIINNDKEGIKLIFEDTGRGIADINLALKDGYSTGSGMGLGLGGSKRLMDEFDIVSEQGKGTKVSIIRWR